MAQLNQFESGLIKTNHEYAIRKIRPEALASVPCYINCRWPVLQSQSLVAMREPNDEEARLLQQPGSEEQRPPPLQRLLDLEMAMGCDLVCEHFLEDDETASTKGCSRLLEEGLEDRQSEEAIDDGEDRDVGVA